MKFDMKNFSVHYFSGDKDVKWIIDDECVSPPSLQVIYKELSMPSGVDEAKEFWMYLSDEDAINLGRFLLRWGKCIRQGQS